MIDLPLNREIAIQRAAIAHIHRVQGEDLLAQTGSFGKHAGGGNLTCVIKADQS